MKKETNRKRPIFKSIQFKRDLSNVVLPEPSRTVNIGSREHHKDYLLLYCGYDCETTTVRTPDGWQSAVYMHQLSIAADNDVCYVYLLRTWDEIMQLFSIIKDHYNLSKERRIIIWDFNLSYEFSFLQFRFEWDEVFAKEERQPLLASTGGIDFREAQAISGGNLAHLAKEYCYTQKAVGDLDFKKLRNYHTILTQQELGYMIADVVILAEFSYMIYKKIIIPSKYIPLTRTGIFGQDIKKRYKKLSNNLDKYGAHSKVYRKWIRDCFPDKDTYYEWFNFLFRGGYVHANAAYSGVRLRRDQGLGVRMWDITSSYPAEMLTGYVPCSKFVRTEYNRKDLLSKCCIIYARFINIRITTCHSIESKNKIISFSDDTKWDNGRLVSSSEIYVCLSEIDLKIYTMFMKWDRMVIHDFYTAKRGKLPKFLTEKMLDCYTKKQKLKKEGKSDTPEYTIYKADTNTGYGYCCKRIRIDTITYINEKGWDVKKLDKDFDKERDKQLLLPQFGIWITAGARFSLLSVAKKLDDAGVQCCYFDTDSIKYIEHPSAERIIKAYNKKKAKHLKRRGYRSEYLKGLGEYMNETPDKKDADGNIMPGSGLVDFKTLGAKRYLTYDGKDLKATIAGLPKNALRFHGSPDDTFDFFSESGMFLDCGDSMKKTTVYHDYEYSIYIDGEWMTEKSGVAIYEIPFTLRLADSYNQYIQSLRERARIGCAV